MKHPSWLIALNVVLALLFVVAAGLQYNDPDPARWIALYGGAAVATVLALHTRRGWLLAGAVGAIGAVWGGLLWADILGQVVFSDMWRKMSEKGGKVEVLREAGGLTLVVTWLSVTSLLGWNRARATAAEVAKAGR